jgi:anhydro-N-acetylmuramic acid kinase
MAARTKRISLRLEGSPPHYAAGLMSGTSHDGISAALVAFGQAGGAAARGKGPPLKLLAFETFPYPEKFRARLLRATSGEAVGTGEISQLNFAVGDAFGKAAIKISRRAGLPLERLSFIGSHGHTFFHLPPRRAARGETSSTLQLGEPAVIAAIAGAPVVADFRPMDIALGGEGAPLAPLAHIWLFGDPKRGRIVQNIGGIGNATWLPPGVRPGAGGVIAFDTGPGGMIIDAFAAKLTGGKSRMDRGGGMAARGQVSTGLLGELMHHPYFRRRPPKSTGREEFGAAYIETIDARAGELGVGGDDLMATVTALTAHSIADACRRFIMPLGRANQLIATGGGARNPTLLRMIARELDGVEVTTASQIGIDGDALEAVAFAILAYQMIRGEPGNVPSVTGARSAAILGKLTLPP